MIKLIQFLISGCWHKWEIHKEGDAKLDGRPNGTAYDLKCCKCGDIKFKARGGIFL